MKKSHTPLFILWAALICVSGPVAQDSTNHAADRKELLSILAGVEDGLNHHDLAGVKKYLHSDAIVTFQDAEVVKGADAFDAYYNRKFGNASSVLASFSTKASVDAPAVFYGNVAVACGHTADRFVFRGGREFNLNSKWTATLRKDDGQWTVMALHFSTDLFDNPLLNMAKDKLIIVGVGSFILGLLLSFVAMKWIFRKR